jgi:hypothetical protein
MEDKEKIDLKWQYFWSRIGLAVITMIAGLFVKILLEESTGIKLVTSIALLGFIYLALLRTCRRTYNNSDSFERRVEALALSQAAIFILVFLMIVVITEQVRGSDISTVIYYVYQAPGLLIFYKTMMSQCMRYRLATGKESSFARFL